MTEEQTVARSQRVEELTLSYADRTAKIAVIGLGYVGLPLCLAALDSGFIVVGVDIDASKIAELTAGRSYFTHIPGDKIYKYVSVGKFKATTDFEVLRSCDAIIICVPTPMTAQREPDLSYIISTVKEISLRLRRDHLVVLESTTWPGTTSEVVKPLLETTGLESGVDFFLAFSPEREDPGNGTFTTGTIPKVVGGDCASAKKIACAMYQALISTIVPVSSTQTAEAVKLTENIFRAVNIALVNELKIIYTAMGIDVWEVIDAAKTKPFGFMPFYPGPGLGGHCVPIDPFYLTWKAREYELSTNFIELAGQINSSMPRYVVERLSQGLDLRFREGLNGADILLVGMAYKKNVSDIRESPALKLMALLEARGAVVSFYDPFVDAIPNTREHPEYAGRRSVSWTAATLSKCSASIIVTDHDSVEYSTLVENCRLILDTRNVLARRQLVLANVIQG